MSASPSAGRRVTLTLAGLTALLSMVARGAMRSMMKTHLDQTLSEAQDRLAGHYAADIRDYDAVHKHILVMADSLSAGIINQFPQRFR